MDLWFLFLSPRFSHLHNVCWLFSLIHTQQLFQDPPLPLPYQPSLVSSLFKRPIVSNLCPYTRVCGHSLVYGQPTRGHTLKENWHSFSQHLSTANHPSARGRRGKVPCPPSSSCWDFVCLEIAQVLGMLSQLLWVHMWCFGAVIHCLWFLQSFCPSYNDPWVLRGGHMIQMMVSGMDFIFWNGP